MSESEFGEILAVDEQNSAEDEQSETARIVEDDNEQKLNTFDEWIEAGNSEEIGFLEKIRGPRLIFKSHEQYYSIWKCLITRKKNNELEQQELRKLLNDFKPNQKWCIMLSAGGHFAGAVFENNRCICHKSFHHYTVRKKAGGSQSAHDSANGPARSAGAWLRRQGEKKLYEQIERLVVSWASHIAECSAIFIRAIDHTRTAFFSGPIAQKDQRVRKIPITTARPTFDEVQRVHGVLSTVQQLDEESVEKMKNEISVVASAVVDPIQRIEANEAKPAKAEVQPAPTPKKKKKKKKKPALPALIKAMLNNEDPARINELIRETNSTELKNWIDHGALYFAAKLGLAHVIEPLLHAGYSINTQHRSFDNSTALHGAAHGNQSNMMIMLLELGADAAIKDANGKTAFAIADKNTQTVMRLFAGRHPECDFARAGVAPLSKEQHELELEQQRKQKLEQKKASAPKAAPKALSDREKRAMAAAKRTTQVCTNCAISFSNDAISKPPHLYCSTKCQVAHAFKLAKQ